MEALVQDRVRPRQVRYQAALRPDMRSSSMYCGFLQLARSKLAGVGEQIAATSRWRRRLSVIIIRP
jgi:hypothetical protein